MYTLSTAFTMDTVFGLPFIIIWVSVSVAAVLQIFFFSLHFFNLTFLLFV